MLKTITSQEIKQRLYDLGADLCGIASIDRFDEAPIGFHPRDVLPSCKSVIVFANRFLAGTLSCTTTIPYTIVRNILSDKMDKVAVEFCIDLERDGVLAIPTGTIGPTEYDKETGRFRNIVSAKHAAQAAGLGVIGRNTLLVTPQYGNMVWLSVILTELELEPDEIMKNTFCVDCDLCVETCPVHAVGKKEMNQQACQEYAFGGENGAGWKIKCYRCREVCPYCFGTDNYEYIRK